jgi:hypothetical protein
MNVPEPGGNLLSFRGQDRRHGIRFPIKSELRWVVLNRKIGPLTGRGETVDFSSSGLSFLSDVPLSPGCRLELSVDWPVELDGRVPMRLLATGKVTRAEGLIICVVIEKTEFRTARRKTGRPVA